MLTNSPPNLPSVREDEFLPPISGWTTFGGLFIVAVVALAFPVASVAKYKETVKVQALVRPDGELRLVQAATEGQVMSVAVKGNQKVKRGDIIATINDSRLQTQKSQLQDSIQQSRLQQVQINAQINALNSQIVAETDRIKGNVAGAIAEHQRIQREYQDKQITTKTAVQETESNLKAAEAALNAAKAKLNRYRSAAKQGAISHDQLEEVKLAWQQQQQAVEAAKAKLAGAQTALNPSNAEIAIATSRITEAEATGKTSLATLTKEKEALIQQQIEINKQLDKDTRDLQQVNTDLQQTIITATTDGIVSKLNLRNPGQTVRPGEEIAQIAPSNSKLTIKASVPAKEIGKLKKGQIAQMRVSACPYSDYGTLKGTVTAIAPDAAFPQPDNSNTPSSANTSSQQTGAAFYEVAIEPNNRSLGKENNQCAIQLGMEGQTDIITREETVMKFLLRKARLSTNL
ncbi:HlyD family secretion protein [Pleurocapsa sp. CCALA 161]|uniref:HlyD family secretion protein n=1 Tax=Pleurocapsa sp. CCALA 161 TaxID=2107688 RepID=UPI000D067852|nr:HlyD family efflux transporter periplasmic adaptor subunit [Pleurocapsa sp. CCALA 161]PSB06237.1 HlyD family secretion protein [Pleurocapsa sp. CCALA 161]